MLHVYHVDCFESNKENEQDVKCPICGEAMKLASKINKPEDQSQHPDYGPLQGRFRHMIE